MQVRVLFFGALKDIAGRAQDEVQLPEPARLSSIFDHYASQFPRMREMASSIVMARNHEFAPLSTPVSDGDEVAFLPPVSGGLGYEREIDDPAGHFFALTRARIESSAIVSRIQSASDGAVVTFEGVVRNNTKGRPTLFLEYECYEEMALKMMAQIGLEIARSNAIGRIAMVHRLGSMAIGETSVAVVVAAPHRGPAFAAALEGINRLKKLVPIWKKEHFTDGEVWVEGEWDEHAPTAGQGLV